MANFVRHAWASPVCVTQRAAILCVSNLQAVTQLHGSCGDSLDPFYLHLLKFTGNNNCSEFLVDMPALAHVKFSLSTCLFAIVMISTY